MARKGNNSDKLDGGVKDTETKRRYQSPQTPPQAPRSRTQQDREQRSQGMEEDGENGQMANRGGQQQGTEGTQGQEDVQSQQGWDGEGNEDGANGRPFGQADGMGNAQRGSDFDLQGASRDELNAIARELNIAEFDSMNREELVTEIRERS